ncbi:hypothetical protein GCM10009546_06820 [Actinomadura livida]|uniref:Uncharacterized protein n=1 Tax=Actinomadura livida TaxID=79909 RepID=A0ABP3NPX6_9ACTN|nr:hypothetical protein GCM10010208_55650 [Actinomadura livida]
MRLARFLRVGGTGSVIGSSSEVALRESGGQFLTMAQEHYPCHRPISRGRPEDPPWSRAHRHYTASERYRRAHDGGGGTEMSPGDGADRKATPEQMTQRGKNLHRNVDDRRP